MVELVLDVRRGATAEALLGALIEAGASLEEVDAAVAALGRGEVRLQVQASAAGSTLRIRAPHGAPVHETWERLRPRIELLAVDEEIAARTLAVLDALFAARAAVHGVQPHEVDVDPFSGPDDLADAVALAAAVHSLGVDRIAATVVGHGTGTKQTIEGEVRMPGPVVAALLERTGADGADHAIEVVDPVGAAFVAAADSHGMDVTEITEDGAGRGTGRLPDGTSVTALVLTRSASPAT